jgi:hypothetical protein
MKIRIGSLEVSDVTLDELDALVQRYGGVAPSQPDMVWLDPSGKQPPVVIPRGPHLAADTLTGEPPLLAHIGADGFAGGTGATAVIGGQKMTAAEVAALRKRLASPMPTAGPDDT